MAAAIASLLKARKTPQEKRKLKTLKDASLLLAHVSHVVIKPFPKFPPKWVVGGKESSESISSNKKSPSSLKKSVSRQDLLAKAKKNTNSMSMEADSNKDEEGYFESNLRNAYSGVYIGLVLCAIGLVITFVGLGEKGFKTTELRLIGPILLLLGAICIVIKILQCSFPNLFKKPAWLSRSSKLSDNSTDKRTQNGHLTTNSSKSSPQAVGSPRVTLQSAKKIPRPRSTIPNFIEDSTDDEDDFDPGRPRPYPSRLLREDSSSTIPPQRPQYNNEIVLTPKTLML